MRLEFIYRFFVTGCGLGLIPFAPGTWGSLLGLPLGYVLNRYTHGSVIPCLAAISMLTVLAVWLVTRIENLDQTHDHPSIVIDEVIGQACTVCFFSPHPAVYISGFLLFRMLDIGKPSLIGIIDHQHTPWSTVLDDVAAGLIGALIIGASIALLRL